MPPVLEGRAGLVLVADERGRRMFVPVPWSVLVSVSMPVPMLVSTLVLIPVVAIVGSVGNGVGAIVGTLVVGVVPPTSVAVFLVFL